MVFWGGGEDGATSSESGTGAEKREKCFLHDHPTRRSRFHPSQHLDVWKGNAWGPREGKHFATFERGSRPCISSVCCYAPELRVVWLLCFPRFRQFVFFSFCIGACVSLLLFLSLSRLPISIYSIQYNVATPLLSPSTDHLLYDVCD